MIAMTDIGAAPHGAFPTEVCPGFLARVRVRQRRSVRRRERQREQRAAV